MKNQILRYWLAMNASAFDSGVVALKAFVGASVAHTAVDAVPALTLQQIAGVFLVAFGMAILDFLKANPVEKLFPVAAPLAIAAAEPIAGDLLSKVNASLEAETTKGTEGTQK